MIKRIWALVYARNMEFFRDRASLSWNLIFPLFVILGFGYGFAGGNQNIFKVAVVREATDRKIPFLDTQYIKFVEVEDLRDAEKKLSHHQYDMLLQLGPSDVKYAVNGSSPKGYLVEKLLLADLKQNAYLRRTVEGREIRYVDWLVAGMLGMNMMFSALFGVGYSIVRYRKNGVLKRLKASPVTAFEFLSAQILSRLIVILTMSSLIFVGSQFLVKFVMLGSYSLLLGIFSLGALCLISLGLLVASFVRSEELAGGLLQLLSWPMMFFSGVWFSLEGFSPVLKKIASALPLTHVIDASRAIMTEGAGWGELQIHFYVLAVLSVIFLALASWAFRWE